MQGPIADPLERIDRLRIHVQLARQSDAIAQIRQVVDDAPRVPVCMRVVRIGAAADRILSGVDHVARRRAHGGSREHVGIGGSFPGQPVEIRCVDHRIAQGAGVAVGHVVGDEQQDVRTVPFLGAGRNTDNGSGDCQGNQGGNAHHGSVSFLPDSVTRFKAFEYSLPARSRSTL